MRSDPVTINLASDLVVLRAGIAGEDGEPAKINGEVRLDLPVQCSIKDISFFFSGRAHTSFTESTAPFKSHHLDEVIFNQEFSMLASFSGAAGSSSSGHHSHTLNAGEHTFPFTLDLPPELPATIFTASSSISYRIKVVVVRPGFTERNWVARRAVTVHHGLRSDAMEYQSSLDIENDWPGKISYAITIPFKAHAAGAAIPCHVKFVPHEKGIRVSTLITTVRQHTTLYSKNHQTSMSRDVLQVKHDLSACPGDTSPGVAPVDYVPPDSASAGSTGGLSSPPQGARALDPAAPVLASELRQRLASVSIEDRGARPEIPRLEATAPSSSSAVGEDDDEEMGMSNDVHTVIRIQLPSSATPTHTRSPIVITHRIKWSALIRNPDGHTSELRCALPLHILAHDLGEEARLASSGASNLLFGPSGVLLPTTDEAANVQLPSYRDHVHDRVANAHAPSHFTTEYAPASWSASARSSPAHTPSHTPAPSRPGSPTFGHTSSGGNSGSRTPAGGASSASLSNMAHQPVNWADEELVSTLHTAGAQSPPNPNAWHAHPENVRLPISRATSHTDAAHGGDEQQHYRPSGPSRASSNASLGSGAGGSSSRFHLHIPKPLRSFTSLGKHAPSAHNMGAPTSSSLAVNAAAGVGIDAGGPTSPTSEEDALMMATPRRRPQPLHDSDAPAPLSSISPAPTPEDEDGGGGGDLGMEVLRQVPSYDAATNWLGGGVVPLDSVRGLPDYAERGSTTSSSPRAETGVSRV